MTYDATFVITQQAVNAGGVSNTASVTSKDPSGSDVTDSTDSATEDLIPRTAAMTVVKTADVDDNGDTKNGVGDVIQDNVAIPFTLSCLFYYITVSYTHLTLPTTMWV